MNRKLRYAGVVFAVSAMLLVGLAGSVSAASGGDERVDSDVVITEWTWDDDNERFILDLENDANEPKSITIVEANFDDTGSGQASIEQERMSANSNTSVTFETQMSTTNPSIAVQSSQGVEQEGRMAVISVHAQEELPYSLVPPTAGWLGGAMAFVTPLAYLTRKKLKQASEPQPLREVVQ